MDSMQTWRTFTVFPAMSAATAFRIGVGCSRSFLHRAPSLWRLGMQTWEPSPAAAKAGEELREELLALAQDYTNVTVAELQRGVRDIETASRQPRASQPSGGSSPGSGVSR